MVGRLIVLEGPDGVGKTTIARALVEAMSMKGDPIFYSAFPGNDAGTLGELVYRLHHRSKSVGVDSITPAALQTLHVAAHIDVIEGKLLPALRRGEKLILDRYWWSTWVYGKIAGMDSDLLDGLMEVERRCWAGVVPWKVYLIDRETPLKSEGSMEAWRRIRVGYGDLASTEGVHYPVSRIANTTSVVAAVSAIMDDLSRKDRTR